MISTYTSRTLYISTLENVAWNNIPQENQDLLIKWFKESLLPKLEENISQLHTISTQITEETQFTYPQITNQITTIQTIIADNIRNLTNDDMKDIINRTILYHHMAETLQRWIYQNHYTSYDIKNNIDLLINHSLQHSSDYNQETYELLRTWINDYLINDLQRTIPVAPGGGLDALFG